MPDAPEPADVLARVLESRLVDLHTAMPGTVERFNAATQCADVRPALTRRMPGSDPEDADAHEALPVLPCVPVLYPGSAALGIRWNLSPGDRGMLIFCERDIGAWQEAGADGDPQSPGMHLLAAGVFIPGDFSKAGKWSGLPSSGIAIGGPSAGPRFVAYEDRAEAYGNTDAAALASKVDAELTKVYTTLSSLAGQATFGTPYPMPTSVASQKLKVGG